MKILLIQIKMMGDILLSSMLFKLIKKKYPNSKTYFLIERKSKDILLNNPYIDELIFYDKKIHTNPVVLFNFLMFIRKENFSVTIDIYNKINSMIITLFSSSKIKIGYYKFYSSFLYNFAIKRFLKPKNLLSLAIENRLNLLKPIGIDFEITKPEIYISQSENIRFYSMFFKQYNKAKKPIIILSILGSSSNKTYPIKYMVNLIDFISIKNKNFQLLFNYMPHQLSTAKENYNRCSDLSKKSINFNFYANSIREFVLLTNQSIALIGNEGGSTNISKALGIPTFAIFAPYLNKINWASSLEENFNVNAHLRDYLNYDLNKAKKDPYKFYLKLQPELLYPQLDNFLTKLK